MDNDRLNGLALLSVHRSKKHWTTMQWLRSTLVNSVLVSVLTSWLH